jgi:hypothetical protein
MEVHNTTKDSPRTVTLNLEISSTLSKEVELDFKDFTDVTYLNWIDIGNLLVHNVPNEIELTVSRYIFNLASIDQYKEDNKEFATVIASHLISGQ